VKKGIVKVCYGSFRITLFLMLGISSVFGQAVNNDTLATAPFDFDKLSFPLSIDGKPAFEIEILYTANGLVYVNTELLFKAVKIAAVVSEDGDRISGFMETESKKYLVDYRNNLLKLNDKSFTTKIGIVKDFGFIYVESSLLAKAFGIEVIFNLRNQSVLLKSAFEFPLTKLMAVEKRQHTVITYKNEIVYDSILRRRYQLFRFGVMDWSFNASQTGKGAAGNQLAVTFGAELLFGQAAFSISVNDKKKFDPRQLQYNWRWVDNENKIIKQVQAGKINTNSVAALHSQITGVNLTNTPAFARKAKGFYYLKELTQPNWTVELYINNQLMDFTKADATGFFLFKIPIVYGFTTVLLKFYGPFGEIRTEERLLNLPYTFVPLHQLDYNVSAGIVQDAVHSKFAKLEAGYGLTTHLTLTGGAEYLSSAKDNPLTPYAKMAYQLNNRITFSGAYIFKNKASGLINYHFGKQTELQISYLENLNVQSLKVNTAIHSETNLRLTFPLKCKRLSGYIRSDFSRTRYTQSTTDNANIIFTMGYKAFSFNATTSMSRSTNGQATMMAEIAASCRNKKGFTVTPSIQYNMLTKRIPYCKMTVEKQLKRAVVSLEYENRPDNAPHSISVKLKRDFKRFRANASLTFQNNTIFMEEGFSGSLLFDNNILPNMGSANSNTGKGGVKICTFLDLNNNEQYDAGEPKVKATDVKTQGGVLKYIARDTLLMIADLNAFEHTNLEFSDKALETISWRYKKKRYKVLIDPHQYKQIDIPVIVVGEIGGTVYWKDQKNKQGIGKIALKIYKKNSETAIAEIFSEEDGYFEYLGLEPGDYIIRIDAKQLKRMKWSADVMEIPFTIKSVADGDVVNDIGFVLSKNN
jgi:hypothetical protein